MTVSTFGEETVFRVQSEAHFVGGKAYRNFSFWGLYWWQPSFGSEGTPPAVQCTSASGHQGALTSGRRQRTVITLTLTAPGGVSPQCMFADLNQKFMNFLSHQLARCPYQLIKDVHAPRLQNHTSREHAIETSLKRYLNVHRVLSYFIFSVWMLLFFFKVNQQMIPRRSWISYLQMRVLKLRNVKVICARIQVI